MSTTEESTSYYSRDFIDAKKYASLERHSMQEGANALERITFLQTPKESHQHLDIGCGPGTFTRDYLVPRSLPCKRLVAVDTSPLMIEFAKANSSHDNIMFDVFNFGNQDVEELMAKYGRFDRVYSFLCFHYIKNQLSAYKDLGKVLTPGSGECLVVGAVSAASADSWLQVHLMNRWRDMIPDPRLLYCEPFKFHFDKNLRKVEFDIREMVRAAGLECIECRVYETEWLFPSAKACVDEVLGSFEWSKRVPQCDVPALKAECTRQLHRISAPTSRGYGMRMTLYSLHARSGSSV
ncbi:juvenile hormone acid O-methyltransferase-like [Amblyomma americanum]